MKSNSDGGIECYCDSDSNGGIECYCDSYQVNNCHISGIIKKNIIEFGFGGWMADYSEYTPTDGVFHNGMPGELVHNLFPVLWARANREAVEESGKLGQVMFFMRAGGTGT